MVDEDKAIGQFRLQLNGVFRPFMKYGQDIYVPPAIEATIKLALQLHSRLNGSNLPIRFSDDNTPLALAGK